MRKINLIFTAPDEYDDTCDELVIADFFGEKEGLEIASTDSQKEEETISDGFGNTWPKQCPCCGRDSMTILSPGVAYCSSCG